MKYLFIFLQSLVLTSNIQTDGTSAKKSRSSEQNNLQQKDASKVQNSSQQDTIPNTSTKLELDSDNSNSHSYDYLLDLYNPVFIHKTIESRKKYLKDLNIEALGNIYNIKNNIYYLVYTYLADIENNDMDSNDCPISDVTLCEYSNSGLDFRRTNVQLKVTKISKEGPCKQKFDLFTDIKLVERYFEIIVDTLGSLMWSLYGNMRYADQERVSFDKIRDSARFRVFNKALEEMNIIIINSEDKNVTLLKEKVFRVYKAYIVGMELLGKSLNRFESFLTKSSLVAMGHRVCTKYYNHVNPVTIEKDSIESNELKSLPSQYNLMLNYYYDFCVILFELDKNLKLECLTVKENDLNIKKVEYICKKMNSLLTNFLAEPEKTYFYEGKCTLLRIYAELRDCIYQSIDMISECYLDTLQIDTYEKSRSKPKFNDREKPCHGIANAKHFLGKLDYIKKQIAERNAYKIKETRNDDTINAQFKQQLFANLESEFLPNEMEVDEPLITLNVQQTNNK